MKSNVAWRAKSSQNPRIVQPSTVTASIRWNKANMYIDIANMDNGDRVDIYPPGDIIFDLWDFHILAASAVTSRVYDIIKYNTKTSVATTLEEQTASVANRIYRASALTASDTSFGLNDIIRIACSAGSGLQTFRLYMRIKPGNAPTNTR